MKWFSDPSRSSRRSFHVIAFLTLAAAAPAISAAPVEDMASHEITRNLARTQGGAQIECTTPDGRILQLATAGEQNKSATALIMDNDTVSCPLPEGQTTFVIKLPTAAVLDRLTFVNEKATAAGQLKIAVSNTQLAANSPDWVEVDGSVAFTKKRLFNLLMVGVEARYVKLTFNVEKAGRIASLGLYGGETLERFAWR